MFIIIIISSIIFPVIIYMIDVSSLHYTYYSYKLSEATTTVLSSFAEGWLGRRAEATRLYDYYIYIYIHNDILKQIIIVIL